MSLRRVSSRQRLVSWDAFDATVYGDDTTSDDDDDDDDAAAAGAVNGNSSSSKSSSSGVNVISPSHHHHHRNVLPFSSLRTFESTMPPLTTTTTTISSSTSSNIIPPSDDDSDIHTSDTTGIADDDFEHEDDTFKRKRRWTLTTAHVSTASTATTTTTNSPLLQLPMELQCLIYQYGTLTELRHLTLTCTTLRQSLLAPPDSDHHAIERNDHNDIVESALWQPFCIHQYWPFLQSSRPFIRSIIHSHSRTTNYSDQTKPFDYPVILSMAVPKVPTHIDAALLFPQARSLWVFNENDVRQRRTIRPKMISMNCTILTTIATTTSSSSSAAETKSPQKHEVIQFLGPVGLGDQCIRSNAPLPRPKRIRTTKTPLWNLPYRPDTSTLFQRVFRNTRDGGIGNTAASTTATMMRSSSTGTTTTSSTSLFCPLRRSARIATRRGSSFSSHATTASSSTLVSRTIVPYRPFCVPFMTLTNEINIAPRYIAYYEVTILPLPHQADQNDSHSTATIIHRRYTKETTTVITKMIQYPQLQPDTTTVSNHRRDVANHMHMNRRHNNVISDCVAVGIGTESFPLQHRMPGWDQNSYGYHGDDGGIFHGNGSMIQQYNRTFGVNDTIGCGIDYIQNAIFFTLNGAFLGYAFPLLPKHRDIDLYPIIGMDTQYPILCNFGCYEPFVFDLQSMTQQHATIIQQQIV